MLKTHEQIRLPDENKENHLLLEVNWNPKDKASNHSKLIRVLFPDGTTATIKREHFIAFCFAIGSEEDQQALIPQKVTSVRNYETMLGITATKNIAKGEKINVRVKIPIPVSEEEIISGMGGKRGIKSPYTL